MKKRRDRERRDKEKKKQRKKEINYLETKRFQLVWQAMLTFAQKWIHSENILKYQTHIQLNPYPALLLMM